MTAATPNMRHDVAGLAAYRSDTPSPAVAAQLRRTATVLLIATVSAMTLSGCMTNRKLFASGSGAAADQTALATAPAAAPPNGPLTQPGITASNHYVDPLVTTAQNGEQPHVAAPPRAGLFTAPPGTAATMAAPSAPATYGVANPRGLSAGPTSGPFRAASLRANMQARNNTQSQAQAQAQAQAHAFPPPPAPSGSQQQSAPVAGVVTQPTGVRANSFSIFSSPTALAPAPPATGGIPQSGGRTSAQGASTASGLGGSGGSVFSPRQPLPPTCPAGANGNPTSC